MQIMLFRAISAAAIVFALAAAPGSATTVRTFVSGKGSDAAACSIVAPCRTFTAALAQTTSGGEIVVLDSAGFGAVNITKPVTISNQTGVEGGITVVAGSAVTVNLSTEGTVTLKGLTIDGAGAAATGVELLSPNAGALNVIDCTIRGFNDGIRAAYHPTVAAATMAVFVLDTVITGNRTNGIYVSHNPGAILSTKLRLLLRHDFIEENANGITLDVSPTFVVADISAVDVSYNAGFGINMSINADVTLSSSTLQGNGSNDLKIGIGSQAILVAHNVISSLNNQGNAQADGTNAIDSFGGNARVPYPLN